MFKIVMVDNDKATIDELIDRIPFKDIGFEIEGVFTNSREAMIYLEKTKVDLLLTDIRLRGLSGIELIRNVRQNDKRILVVVLSSFYTYDYIREAMRLGVSDYLLKPLDINKIKAIIMDMANTLNGIPIIKSQYDFDPSMSDSFKSLLDYIQNNYQNRLLLSQLSERFNLNLTYCCELFKKHTGKTYHEYLREMRMKKARLILLNENITIKEVAEKTGVGDYFHFAKAFKKYYGITPGMMRKNKTQEVHDEQN